MWGSFRLAEKYGIGGVFSIAVGLLPVQELNKLPPFFVPYKLAGMEGSGSIYDIIDGEEEDLKRRRVRTKGWQR